MKMIKTTKMTAEQANATIERAAVKRPEVRDFTSATDGQVARQGDIYLTRVSMAHKHGKPCGRQLAQGNTQGSRHVATGDVQCFEGVTLPAGFARETFIGPCVVVGTGGGVVTHPEHAHIALGEGVYQVTHQMDAATRQRVMD
jgi:hypothetical protein